MYRSFYQLQRKPFQITTDPEFLWLGQKHREALATLKYGVVENKGFLLLTGDVGTGKTTLIHALLKSLDENVLSAMIADPGLSRFDFYRLVSIGFKIPGEIRSKSDFLEQFGRFLYASHDDHRTVLLIIDETQRLKHDLLEEIRLLSNIEKADAKLLNIFFVGQNEVNTLITRPENRALRKRISITYNLTALNLDETRSYINHRLKTAGAQRTLFSSGAVEEIHAHSGGSPRQINILCDLALLYGFEASKKTISKKLVRQCREKVSFPLQNGGAMASSPTRPGKPPAVVSRDQIQISNAVLKWAIGVVVVMIVILSVALIFPGRFGNRGPEGLKAMRPAAKPVDQTAVAAGMLQTPLVVDLHRARRRATVTATLAESDDPVSGSQKNPASEPQVSKNNTPDAGAKIELILQTDADAPFPAGNTSPDTDVIPVPSAIADAPLPLLTPSPPDVLLAVEDATPANTRQEQGKPTVDPEPSAGTTEPDPGDIIDWLMKKKR